MTSTRKFTKGFIYLLRLILLIFLLSIIIKLVGSEMHARFLVYNTNHANMPKLLQNKSMFIIPTHPFPLVLLCISIPPQKKEKLT